MLEICRLIRLLFVLLTKDVVDQPEENSASRSVYQLEPLSTVPITLVSSTLLTSMKPSRI